MFSRLQPWSVLKFRIGKYLTADSRILIIGCGTSTMSEEMYMEGFTQIYNMYKPYLRVKSRLALTKNSTFNSDQSTVLIKHLKEKHADKPKMECTLVFLQTCRSPDRLFLFRSAHGRHRNGVLGQLLRHHHRQRCFRILRVGCPR